MDIIAIKLFSRTKNFLNWSGILFFSQNCQFFLSFYNLYFRHSFCHNFMILLHHSDIYIFYFMCVKHLVQSELLQSRRAPWIRTEKGATTPASSVCEWNTFASKSKRNDFHEGIKKKSAGTSRSEIAAVNFASAPCYKRTS